MSDEELTPEEIELLRDAHTRLHAESARRARSERQLAEARRESRKLGAQMVWALSRDLDDEGWDELAAAILKALKRVQAARGD